MEPITAAWVVGILVQHATGIGKRTIESVAEHAEDFVADRVKALVALVRKHFDGDAGAQDALDRLDQKPGDERRRAAVEERVDEALHLDRDFAQALGRVAHDILVSGDTRVNVRDAGAVAVNGNVSIAGGLIASGRDSFVGDAHSEQTP